MTKKHILLMVCLAVNLSSGRAQVLTGNPLNGIEQLKDFETQRASSSDTNWVNGNNDRWPIEPGGTITVADLDGPGVITHIWCTVAHNDPFYSRMLTVRMYWDDESRPSVESPLGDFFGIGHGVDQTFASLPLRVTSDGRARNCYWPMPFRKKAKIMITNESKLPCRSFYFYVDWQKHKSLPKSTAYFHAMYRQEHPCIMGQNYLIADITGKGHYVGTIQSVYHVSPGWYGEGDDFFFIDGEKEPRLRGTGTEDYFCDGWGFRQQDGPFYGTPLWEGGKTGDRGTAYRFHIPDPVTFKKALRVEIEHKGSETFPDGTRSGFIERDDLMSSVGIWYQTEPHKAWPALPAGALRLPFTEELLCKGWEAVKAAKHSPAPLQEQKVSKATDGKQLWFKPTEEKAWIEIPFTIAKAGACELIGKFTHAKDYGKYRVKIDAQDLGTVDLYNPEIVNKPYRWNVANLTAGNHTLRLECAGKAIASTGYLLGFDNLSVRVPVYSRPASVDLRTLQKH